MDNSNIPYTTSWYNNIRSAIGETACKALGLFAIPDDFELSVVIPVYNEEKTLATLVSAVASVPIRK